MVILGAEISEHIFAAGCIALFIAAQCLRNALWTHGANLFDRDSSSGEGILAPVKA